MTASDIVLAASVLSADLSRLGEEMAALERNGRIGLVHVDVMDGAFVPNITFGPVVVQAIRRSTSLPLDVHLMIQQPHRYLEHFARAGANRLTVHVEACPHLHRDLEVIHQLGVLAGVALNPATSVALLEGALDYVDQVLVMTVNPGFGGQRYIPGIEAKVARVREMLARRGRDIPIAVDGGINAETAPFVVRAGARLLVAGSAILGHPKGIDAGAAALWAATRQGEDCFQYPATGAPG